MAGLAHAVEPTRLLRIFIFRSQPTYVTPGGSGLLVSDVHVNLAVLPAMPLFGVLVAWPIHVFKARDSLSLSTHNLTAARAADVFCVVYLSLMLLIYLPRLPVHTSYTVRYLHPLYPIGIYAVVRLPSIRTVIRSYPWWLLGGYIGVVGIGSLGTLSALAYGIESLTVALVLSRVALGIGVMVAVWTVLATEHTRARAIMLSAAAASTTVYIAFYSHVVANHLPSALPIIR